MEIKKLNIEVSGSMKVSMTHAMFVIFEVDSDYKGTAFRCTKSLEHLLNKKRKEPCLHDYTVDQMRPIFATIENEVICMTLTEFKENELTETDLYVGKRCGEDYLWNTKKGPIKHESWRGNVWSLKP